MPFHNPIMVLCCLATLALTACGNDEGKKNTASFHIDLSHNSASAKNQTEPIVPEPSDDGALPPQPAPAAPIVHHPTPAVHLPATPAVTRTVTLTRPAETLEDIIAQYLGKACIASFPEDDSAWAKQLPAAFPIYPKANLIEATGYNGRTCAPRAITFTTKATAQDVMDFYANRAQKAGYSLEHIEENSAHALLGTHMKGAGRYYIRLRADPQGRTYVHLVVDAGR